MKQLFSLKSVYSDIKCIVLDTSFLIELFTRPGLLDEFKARFINNRLYVPKSVYGELVRLSSRGGRLGGAAKLALNFIDKVGINVDAEFDGKADDDVIGLAKKNSCFVATCDSNVIRRCRGAGIRLIFLWRGVLTID